MNRADFSMAMLRFSKVLTFGAPDFKDPDVMNFWFNALKDLPPDRLSSAMNELCMKDRFPSIDQIKTKCGIVQLTDEEIARDAIQRIRHAVGRFGSPNWEQAKEYIGSVGVHCVHVMGGWENVCSFQSYEELDFALVQGREYLKTAVKKDRAGNLSMPPELPSKSTEFSKLISDLANKAIPVANRPTIKRTETGLQTIEIEKSTETSFKH